MIIFEYFFNKMDIFGLKMNSRMEDIEDVSLFICLCVSLSHCLDVSLSLLCYNSLYHPQIFASQATFPDHITRSLLLAISVCYLARLQDRKDYNWRGCCCGVYGPSVAARRSSPVQEWSPVVTTKSVFNLFQWYSVFTSANGLSPPSAARKYCWTAWSWVQILPEMLLFERMSLW